MIAGLIRRKLYTLRVYFVNFKLTGWGYIVDTVDSELNLVKMIILYSY